MIKIKYRHLLLFVTVLTGNVFSADVINPLGQENSFMGMDRQTGFIISSVSALASYLISDFLLKDPHLDFYQIHAGYYHGYSGLAGPTGPTMPGGDAEAASQEQIGYHLMMENFGVEREFSEWFSMLLEANIEEFAHEDYFTFGGGLKAYYRWTLLRSYRVHPYIEYGAGIFYSLDEFPENGSAFTFNLNYAVGAEYILPNKDKIRLDLNFKHHSNNNLYKNNPGYDANGVSLSYCRFWK